MKISHKVGSVDGHRIGDLVDEAKAQISDMTKTAMRVEGEFIDEAKRRGGELIDSAQDKSQEAWKRTAKWIGNNPAAAVGIAFTGGVLLRSFFGRSKK
jgi:ElaB/YqjD/DUF883 family membrane-anchored ribosome-binding protein